MKIRYLFALWCAKLSYGVLTLLKRSASTFPGAVALKLCPNFLALSPKAPTTVCVTGTNGKTTTTNTIAAMLREMGLEVRTNAIGANIGTGVATVLTRSVTFFGKMKVDADVFEVDERYSRLILPFVKPDYLVVTAIFRDSIKRNAHPDYIFSIINDYTPEHTEIIINADDLCAIRLRPDNKRAFFGIGPMPGDVTEPYCIISDHTICPVCHAKLKFNYLRYHHIGNAYCPACGFKSPDADYLVQSVDEDNMTLTASVRGTSYTFPLINKILFNVYNEIAVIAFLCEFGASIESIQSALARMDVVKSRLSQEKAGNAVVIKAMSKGQSAVSSCRAIDFVSKEPGNKSVVLLLDDWYERQDSSEFIGWIFDVDFEFLNKPDVVQVLALGPRSADYQIRLEMAGIPPEKILCDMSESEGVKKMRTDGVDSVYVLYDTSTLDLANEIAEEICGIFEAAAKEGN